MQWQCWVPFLYLTADDPKAFIQWPQFTSPQCLACLSHSKLQPKWAHLFFLDPQKPCLFRWFFFSLPSASWISLIYLQPLSLRTSRYQAWPRNQYELVKQDISSLFCSSKWGKLPVVTREQLAAQRPFLCPCMAKTEMTVCQEHGPRLNSKT